MHTHMDPSPELGPQGVVPVDPTPEELAQAGVFAHHIRAFVGLDECTQEFVQTLADLTVVHAGNPRGWTAMALLHFVMHDPTTLGALHPADPEESTTP